MCFELGWHLAPVCFDDCGVGVAPQLADCAVFVGFTVQDWSSCVTAHQRRRMRGWASSLRCLGRRIRRLIMTIPFPFPLFSFAAQFSLLFSSQSHPLYGLLSSSRRELVSGYSQTPDPDFQTFPPFEKSLLRLIEKIYVVLTANPSLPNPHMV